MVPIASAQDRLLQLVPVQKKHALVIGNSAYPGAPLQNAPNDATLIETTLRQLAFDDVRVHHDLTLQKMDEAIDEFAASLTPGSLALFYFAGHGLQVNFANYLLPTDFSATTESDVKYKAYPASRIQDKLESSPARLRVLVLDACRNNPFRFKRESIGGLGAMSVNAEGTLIAFSKGTITRLMTTVANRMGFIRSTLRWRC
jgi:uncharacterized caspase-like protein